MLKLSAVKRDKKGEKVREEGLLPAVVYGAGKGTESLSLNNKEFNKLYQEAGESTLIDLQIDGKEAGKVLVQDVQYDPVKDFVIHVDFKRIDMNKPLVAPVELVFVNESPIIKESGGTLVRQLEEVEVECLPKDLVSHLDVDLSVLKTFDDAFRVADLKLPPGVEIYELTDDIIIVKAIPALTEEQIKAMEEKSTEADVSKIEEAGKEAEGEEEGEEKKDEEKKGEEQKDEGKTAVETPSEKGEEKKGEEKK